MKKGLAAILFLLFIAFPLVSHGEEYSIDPVHSTVVYKVRHLNISYFYGRFDEVKGKIHINRDQPEKSSVEVIIRADSIDTHNKKRDKHLRSPDFFNVRQFPLIKFKSTDIKKVQGDTYRVSGKLFLHGVERPLQLLVTKTGEGRDPWGDYRIGFHTHFTIKRSDYGMTYMIPGVGDEVEIFMGIEAIKEK